MSPLRILVGAGACVLILAAVAGAAGGDLHGVVGPGFNISVTDASGASVSHLDPGTFTLVVDDKADDHNFHLTGPGVDVSTDIAAIGTKTFSLNLVDGKYSFICDAHPTQMAGSFTVGTPPPDPTPPPKPKPKPATRLVLTVTGTAVTLTTPAGARVKSLRAGAAVITVHDRSAKRGASLRGAGVSRTTTVGFVGTKTWPVQLTAGTLVYSSDSRKPVLRGGRVPVS
jgi:hypothetical protein